MVPYADFNLLKFPDKAQAMDKIRDLTCLSDILPTRFHGAVTAKVGVGSTVYVAGAGPVGLAAAASARILGAAAVLVGDMNKERLAHARKVGFEPIDLTRHDRLGELVADVLGVPEVDSAIDCVGFEATAQGTDGSKRTAAPCALVSPKFARMCQRAVLTNRPLPELSPLRPKAVEPVTERGTAPVSSSTRTVARASSPYQARKGVDDDTK
jgi:threonine dehydrogenase-like Zn-dependent dehydrogenase